MTNFICSGCGVNVDTIREYAFMLEGELWESTGFADGFACIGCVESAIGRHLTSADFPAYVPINHDVLNQSARIRSRIGDKPSGVGNVNSRARIRRMNERSKRIMAE